MMISSFKPPKCKWGVVGIRVGGGGGEGGHEQEQEQEQDTESIMSANASVGVWMQFILRNGPFWPNNRSSEIKNRQPAKLWNMRRSEIHK